MKIIDFRRYYRSIRHYAVRRRTKSDIELLEQRCDNSFLWCLFYFFDERIFMRKPPVEHHSNMPREDEEKIDQVAIIVS